jgi:hypothetical protein
VPMTAHWARVGLSSCHADTIAAPHVQGRHVVAPCAPTPLCRAHCATTSTLLHNGFLAPSRRERRTAAPLLPRVEAVTRELGVHAERELGVWEDTVGLGDSV